MRYHFLTGLADATDATFVARRTQEKDLVLFLFNGKNHQEFNENWQEWVDFYDCGAVFENGYTPADDATEGVKATCRTRTASAEMLLRKHMSASVRKIIRTSSEDTPSEMFEMLQLNFFQNDTNEKT